MKLTHRVAVVTGAASGIGRAMAHVLAGEDARLILVDRDAPGVESLAKELTADGVRCVADAVDVRQREALRRSIRSMQTQLGPVDLLVACAGITGVTLVEELRVEQLQAITEVNYLGVVYSIDAVLPEMIQRRQGHIVGVSSLAGCRGMPFSAAYSASKTALSTYLESLRPSLRRRGVTVTTVCPGFVRTPLMANAPLQPPMRMLEPEEAARYILRAIRRRRAYYCFPWAIGLGVRSLKWLPPRLYDWAMSRAAAKIPNLTY